MSLETNLGSVDYSALTAPIDAAEVAAFEAETARRLRWIPRPGSAASPVSVAVLAVIFVGIPATVLVGALLAGAAGWWGAAVGVGPLCVSVIALALVFLVPTARAPRRAFGWEEHYRLSRFAWENGLAYATEAPRTRYKGVLFYNLPAVVYNHLTPKTGRFFDIGNIRYGGAGKDRSMSDMGHRGFLAVHLGGRLPHIILDAKANDGLLGGIGLQLSDRQTMRLEGDFSEHFTLYCPVGYEHDALYILTPDLMSDLLDESLPFDVELIGDWMFVYAMTPFDLTDPNVFKRLFRIVETVGARAVRRSVNYRDDQYSSPEAAAAKPRGSRMPVAIPRRVVVMGVVLVASLMWIPTGLFFGSLIGHT